MESGLEIDDGNETKGGMWVLDQKLDQPMEEEAGSLRNVYREKVLIDYKYFQKLKALLLFLIIAFPSMENC